MRRKSVSLAAELTNLLLAVHAARMIADQISDGRERDLHDTVLAPQVMSAVLVLVAVRMHQVVSVLGGEEDVSSIWTPTNDGEQLTDDNDVILKARGSHKKEN